MSGALESAWYEGGPLAALLLPLAVVFAALARVRRSLYRLGLLGHVELGTPVIVVGNITVGGAGKTPLTAWLARELAARGLAPGILASGYRGRARHWPQPVSVESDPREVGDEPVLLAKLTGCPVVAGRDRVAGGRRLLAEHPVDVLISDDGLQHYRLARQFEIAVVDGERGLGNGRSLPAGPLREPPSRLREVDAVVVNGAGWGASGAFRAELRPGRLYRLDGGGERCLDEFTGSEVHAVAGIANPARFFRMLEGAGLRVLAHPLPDHAPIEAHALRFADARPVLITEKDAVKCTSIAHPAVWVVPVELGFAGDDGARLVRLILDRLERVGVPVVA